MTTILDAEIITTTATETAIIPATPDSPNNYQQLLNQAICEALESYRKSNKLTSATNDDELLVEFLSIRAKNSENTLKAYKNHCNQFLSWLNSQGYNLENLTVTLLGNYEESLRSSGLSNNSVATKMKSVKSLISYASDVGYLPNNPGRVYGSPTGEAAVKERALKPENLEEQKESEISIFFQSIDNLNHYLIFETLAKTGLRASELIGLTWSSELTNQPGCFQTIGKGNKARVIHIPHDLYKKLLTTKKDGIAYIFHTNRNKKYSYQYLYKLCKKYVKKSAINQSCTPHWFRHYYANELRLKGVDVYDISKLLGHSSVAITQSYFHFDYAKKFNDLITIK